MIVKKSKDIISREQHSYHRITSLIFCLYKGHYLFIIYMNNFVGKDDTEFGVDAIFSVKVLTFSVSKKGQLLAFESRDFSLKASVQLNFYIFHASYSVHLQIYALDLLTPLEL